VYSDERAEYTVDDNTGELRSTVTRTLPGGGTEVVIRTGTDSLGGGATYGYTVKPEYLTELFRIATEQQVFAPACRNVPVTQGVEVKYPALDQYQAPTLLNGVPQSAAFAGITLSYLGETATRVSSDGKTNEIDFKIVDMTGATDYSRDYIVDSYVNMEPVITGIFGEAMAFIEDWVVIRGTGLGQPQGYFKAAATIQGGAAAGNASRANAGEIASDDLAWMLSHLSPQCWRSARWITHPSTLTQLFILQNKSGTNVFQPNSLIAQSDQLSIMKGSTSEGLTNRPMGILFGYPVYFSEKVPQLGTTGDISLVCPSQYGLATRSGIEIGVSEHFYFSTDRIAYRFKRRHDGRSLWRNAYTDISGATTSAIGTGWTSSPFIVLN
jgi:HK97 family phage major capsid protein